MATSNGSAEPVYDDEEAKQLERRMERELAWINTRLDMIDMDLKADRQERDRRLTRIEEILESLLREARKGQGQ